MRILHIIYFSVHLVLQDFPYDPCHGQIHDWTTQTPLLSNTPLIKPTAIQHHMFFLSIRGIYTKCCKQVTDSSVQASELGGCTQCSTGIPAPARAGNCHFIPAIKVSPRQNLKKLPGFRYQILAI